MATAIRFNVERTCSRCGSHSILPEYDLDTRALVGKCCLCGHTYSKSDSCRDRGRAGGLTTLHRHGRSYMIELARKGGRPKLSHLTALENNNGKEDELPNDRRKLIALWMSRKSSGSRNIGRDGVSLVSGSIPARKGV